MMTPDATTPPTVLNPTPTPLLGFPPIWRPFSGFVVPIPTLPSTYIGVTPIPVLTSVHCDVGRFDNVEPSPLNDDAVTTPVSYTHLTLPTNREV